MNVPVVPTADLMVPLVRLSNVYAESFDQALVEFAASVGTLAQKDALAGHIELDLAEHAKPLLRQALEKALQAQADKHGPLCPHCRTPLKRTKLKQRTLRSQWGDVTVRRVWGYCPGTWAGVPGRRKTQRHRTPPGSKALTPSDLPTGECGCYVFAARGGTI